MGFRTSLKIVGALAVPLVAAAPALAARAAGATDRRGVAALERLVQGYRRIKSLSFTARAVGRLNSPAWGHVQQKLRYTFFGQGRKYRIDFQNYLRESPVDMLITDNGRHFRCLNRINGTLTIMHTHPTHGALPTVLNPALVPLAFLTPPHATQLWMNFARLARSPRSVLRRCRRVRMCAPGPRPGTLYCCVKGSLTLRPAKFKVLISLSPPRVLRIAVTRPKSGRRLLISHIKYRVLSHGIVLPISFSESAVGPGISGSMTFELSRIRVDRAPPPGIFSINFKDAKMVINENRGTFMPVRPHLRAPKAHS